MHSNESVLAANESLDNRTVRGAAPRSPLMFAFIFAVWIASLLWFGPRLLQSLEAARGPVSSFALHYFVTFIPVAWLYGIYNLSVVLFAIISRLQGSIAFAEGAPDTPVAVLYTTCYFSSALRLPPSLLLLLLLLFLFLLLLFLLLLLLPLFLLLLPSFSSSFCFSVALLVCSSSCACPAA